MPTEPPHRVFAESARPSLWSLRHVFALIVGIPVFVLFGLLLVQSYYTGRIAAARTMREHMIAETTARARALNHHLATMSRNADQIAVAIGVRKPDNLDAMLSLQYAMLSENPNIYGTAIAWEPFLFDPKEKHVCPYVWRDAQNDGAVSNTLFAADYDYLAGWNWYDRPKAKYGGGTGEPPPLLFSGGETEQAKLPRIEPGLWCTPYFDEGGGNILMCTYSAPFFQDRRFGGVVTCDVTTDWIGKFLNDQVFEGGWFILISQDGSVISHPNERLIMEHFTSLASFANPLDRKVLLPQAIETAIQSFEPDLLSLHLPEDEGEYRPELSLVLRVPPTTASNLWAEGVRLPSSGWILLCVVPEKTVYRSANAQHKNTVLLFLCGVLLFGAYLYWEVDHRVIRPLRQLGAATHAVAEGQFDHQIETDFIGTNELSELVHNFNAMTGALRRSIDEAVLQAAEREAAVVANRAKSAFLANMSHEIRTPMNGVLGLADLLAKTSLDTQQNLYITHLRNSAKSLLAVIDDVLDISQVEAGKFFLSVDPFNLREIFDDVCRSLEFVAVEKKLDFSQELSPGLPEVLLGDAVRFRQILFNVIGNALKFTQQGSVVARCHGEVATGRYHLFCEVADTGIGIPEKYLPVLFEPFMQVDSSMTREFGGTGLGLTIVKRLIEYMGGIINVASEPELGTTVRFFVPFDLPKDAAPPLRVQPVAALANEEPRSLSVLLVEDVKINVLVATQLLLTMGHEITVAENGLVALEKLRENDFDVVLMDCQMPVMDGYQCVQALRRSDSGVRNPSIPVIAMTAHAMRGDREKCLEAGMDDYITKPIDGQLLAEKLKQYAT